MIALGLVLIIVNLLLGGPPVLTTIGVILLVVGIVLNLVPIAGERRRVW